MPPRSLTVSAQVRTGEERGAVRLRPVRSPHAESRLGFEKPGKSRPAVVRVLDRIREARAETRPTASFAEGRRRAPGVRPLVGDHDRPAPGHALDPPRPLLTLPAAFVTRRTSVFPVRRSGVSKADAGVKGLSFLHLPPGWGRLVPVTLHSALEKKAHQGSFKTLLELSCG